MQFSRQLLGSSTAGHDDNGPFKTYLDWSIAPEKLTTFFKSNGYEIVFQRFYDPMLHSIRERHPFAAASYDWTAKLLSVISFGTLGGNSNSGFVILLRRPQ